MLWKGSSKLGFFSLHNGIIISKFCFKIVIIDFFSILENILFYISSFFFIFINFSLHSCYDMFL